MNKIRNFAEDVTAYAHKLTMFVHATEDKPNLTRINRDAQAARDALVTLAVTLHQHADAFDEGKLP